jgi:hypothetical protein
MSTFQAAERARCYHNYLLYKNLPDEETKKEIAKIEAIRLPNHFI